jgi:hypothetical protein
MVDRRARRRDNNNHLAGDRGAGFEAVGLTRRSIQKRRYDAMYVEVSIPKALSKKNAIWPLSQGGSEFCRA